MAKTSGLSVRLYAGGYDISGDVSAISSIAATQNLLEVTGLTSSAIERIAGLADGAISINGWFNASASQIHAALLSSGKVPTTDVVVLVPLGTSIGDPCAFMNAKEAAYNLNRGADGSLAVSSEFSGNGYGAEWGVNLTAAKQTDASAANSTSVDGAASSTGGGSAVVEVFSLASGTVTPVVQDSADNSSFSTILTFTARGTSDVPVAERKQTAAGATVRRYTRFATTGTFTNAVVACGFRRG